MMPELSYGINYLLVIINYEEILIQVVHVLLQ